MRSVVILVVAFTMAAAVSQASEVADGASGPVVTINNEMQIGLDSAQLGGDSGVADLLEKSRSESALAVVAGYPLVPARASVVRWTGAGKVTVLRVNGNALEACKTLAPAAKEVVLDPSYLSCVDGKELTKGGLIVVIAEEGGQRLRVVRAIPDLPNPILRAGGDYGIGLTLLDMWSSPEGSRLHAGLSGYFALSELKTRHCCRVIAHLTLLDQMDNVDFELGVGLGLAYKQTSIDENGLAFALGVGRNLMADDGAESWYTFFGVNWNVDTRSSR